MVFILSAEFQIPFQDLGEGYILIKVSVYLALVQIYYREGTPHTFELLGKKVHAKGEFSVVLSLLDGYM